jgi:exodeoxyribonuclease VII large subunit
LQTFSLYELNSLVRETIESEMAREYWVEAELSEVRESRGHCYMELVQKDVFSTTPVARAAAKCWRTQWTMIQPHFERVTGQRLHAGMKVRLQVYPQFHEAYGFSWIVTDIDPNFTLGDLARRRQEIVRQLHEEGVFDLQRELTLPLFCLRIAVVSSETAAGYGDFQHQLYDSPYAFHSRLFPAIMQGEQVEQSIIAALNAIYQQTDDFDCVVIIRGGGATADLSGFDTLALAENVAQFPLPIITGIGHDRDESVLDMVSHLRVKTPTAAAAFLIERLDDVAERINQAEQGLARSVAERLKSEQMRLGQLATVIPATALRLLSDSRHRIELIETRLPLTLERLFTLQRHRLEQLELTAKSLDPQLLLQRGYSITLHNGRTVHDPKQLKPGDTVETRVEKGTFKSIIQ